MPRPAHHKSNEDLLNAVREEIARDPSISHYELRSRVGGAQSLVSAAMRAALFEAGRRPLGQDEELDPRFAPFIRQPEPPPELDLRFASTGSLMKELSEHALKTHDLLDSVIERIHAAALAAMDKDRADARERVALAEKRAERAQEFVDGIRCELAETVADADRARAAAAEENGRQALEITRLTRDLEEARAAQLRAEQARDGALSEREAAEIALREARNHGNTVDRDLAAAGARIQELERQVGDLGMRLTQADGERAAARAAEGDAREAAAAARATVAAHVATITRLEAAVAEMRGRKRATRERTAGERN